MKKIKVSDITVASKYLRTDTDIESLKKSIETLGLINPITVNEKNELLAGSRRLQALKELGHEEVTCHVTNLSDLESELISIDENLVRKPLDKLELEKNLNRGREIYEKLNPNFNKVEVLKEPETAEEKKVEKEKLEEDENSFVAVTAEKTGLSKAVIHSAIKRDAKSSQVIKKARGEGVVSASQVNEIIKLDQGDQEMILDHVKDLPVKEVRQVVKMVKEKGIGEAIEAVRKTQKLPKEFDLLKRVSMKVNKIIQQVIIEDIAYEGKELEKIVKEVKKLRDQTDEFLFRYGGEDYILGSDSMNAEKDSLDTIHQ